MGEARLKHLKEKNTRGALQKSEGRYRILFEQTPIGIAVTTLEGRFIEANTALTNMLGYEFEEMQRRDVAEMYENPQDRQAMLEALQRDGYISNRPVSLKRKDGAICYILLTVTMIHDGATNLLLISCVDITEQRRIKAALYESEERYRIAIESSNDGVLIVRGDAQLYVNQKFVDMFGYDKPEDITGKHVDLILHPDDREMVADYISKRQQGEPVPPRYEVKGIKKDGTLIYIEVSATGIVYHGERVSLAFLRDVTERRLAEEALQESEERYRIAIESSNDGVLIVRGDAQLYVNQKFVEMFGYNKPEDIIGKHVDIVVHPDDREMVADYIRKRHRGEPAPPRYEIKGIKRDGEVIHIEVSVTGIVYHGERVSLAFIRDITERKETEVQLKRYQDFLETLSMTDGLTGIANRRRFDEYLELEWHRCMRSLSPLSLILMDIDFFKAFNDNYGHLAGDDCLRNLAQCLAESLRRATDLVARYGGEEFACVLPATDAKEALTIANHIREKVHNLNILHAYSSAADCVTFSMGVATLIPKRRQPASVLISNADKLLYTAKKNGRNQIKSSL